MTRQELNRISTVCRSNTGEYKRVMEYIGISGQLKVFSLGCVEIEGQDLVYAMCQKIEKILGFKAGEIRYRFHPRWGRRGAAQPWFKIVHLGSTTCLETIVHELTHVLCDMETTVRATHKFDENGEYKRTNASVHNRGFAEWLNMAMDNVLEHAEELGIRVYTAEDILRDWWL